MKTREYYLDTKTGKIRSTTYTPLKWYEIAYVLLGLLTATMIVVSAIIGCVVIIQRSL